MAQKFQLINFGFLALSIVAFSSNAQTVENDSLPFLKSDYLYEYLHESKMLVGGNVVSETKMETTYDDNNRIISMVTTMNGQKTLESTDYKYGNRTRSNVTNNYMNGNKTMSTTTESTFADDIYRNMLTSKNEIKSPGYNATTLYEWTYDDKGRIIGMKEFLNGELQREQKDYVWTPKSCEYVEITYAPIPATDKVTKQFQDDYYVQNVLEIHQGERGGAKYENRSEFQYDDNGNIISMKSFLNGQLTMEWKDFVWGDKKSSHTEIMYTNGTPMSTSEVTQYYK